MRVRCVSTFPTEDQILKLGPAFHRSQDFHITVGREYVVLATGFYSDSSISGTGPWISFVTDYDKLGTAPFCLFEILDGKVSQYWEVQVFDDGALALGPASFFKQYYDDDLSELVPEVVADFKRIRALIEEEAKGTKSSLDGCN